jgi:hypothetical protein
LVGEQPPKDAQGVIDGTIAAFLVNWKMMPRVAEAGPITDRSVVIVGTALSMRWACDPNYIE